MVISVGLKQQREWEALDKSIRCLFDSEWDMKNARGKGVGRSTIHKFLGGNWKQWMIQAALAAIKDDEEDAIDLGEGLIKAATS